MHYLKTHLSNEASRLISNLLVSGENFTTAWETLISRYENKRFLVYSQLNKLLNLKPVKNSSARSFSIFSTAVSESLTSLRAQGCPVHQWETVIVYLLVRLLDTDTHKDWEVMLGSSPNLPTLTQFEEFLTGRARAMEHLERNSGNNKEGTVSTASRFSQPAKAHVTAISNTKNTSSCPLCKEIHYLANCPKFSAKSLHQRREFVTSRKLCFNCLGFHSFGKCFSQKRCLRCGGKHHTSLHLDMKKKSSEEVKSDSLTHADQKSEKNI